MVDNSFKFKYEGIKANFETDLDAVENCLQKCTVAYKDTGSEIDKREGNCLKKCYLKYFDSALLLNKELELYTFGTPNG